MNQERQKTDRRKNDAALQKFMFIHARVVLWVFTASVSSEACRKNKNELDG
jgi:hypothetical protein